MDWSTRTRSTAKGSPSPDLIFRMSPPDPHSFIKSDMGVARAPGALMTRARIQSAMGSAPMTPEAQAAARRAAENKFPHPSQDPLSQFMYGSRRPPPPPTLAPPIRKTTRATRVAEKYIRKQDSSSRAPADSHHQSQTSYPSHKPSAPAHGHSKERDNRHNDKGKGKVVHMPADGAHASRGSGDAYKKKKPKFYLNDEDSDNDDEDSDGEYAGGDMDDLNTQMAGLNTRYKSEAPRAATSRRPQQPYWSTLVDVVKPSEIRAHPPNQRKSSLTFQPEQHMEQQVKHQRVHSSRHASGSKKGRSSRTRPLRVHHSPGSPGYAAPTSGTHCLHALAYPYSPDDRFPHPSASEGRPAPIPIRRASPECNIARSFHQTDDPAYQAYMKLVGFRV